MSFELKGPEPGYQHPASGSGTRDRIGSRGEGANQEPETPPPDLQRGLE